MSESSEKVQGEGDYVAGRRFQDSEHAFVENGPVAQKAREAAEALDGPEGAELEAARRETGGLGSGLESEPSLSNEAADASVGSEHMTDREAMQRMSRVREAAGKAGDGTGSDDPAPLSHALHAPTLSDDPAPLSHLLHIPVLSKD